jgi:hypothetical protein
MASGSRRVRMGDEELVTEGGLGAEKARIEKLHDRPKVADVVLNSPCSGKIS